MLHLSDTARSFNLAERCYDGIEETSDESLVRHAIEELCHIYWQRNVKIVDPPIGTTAILATNKKYMELLHFFFQKAEQSIRMTAPSCCTKYLTSLASNRKTTS